MNVLETLGYGGIVAVIGMLIVFLGLIILIVCISIMGQFFKTGKKKEKAAPAPAPAPVAAPAPVVEPVVEEAPACDDAQLIAVIAAALAAFDNGSKRLVVRKVRRVSGWNEAARSENVYRF